MKPCVDNFCKFSAICRNYYENGSSPEGLKPQKKEDLGETTPECLDMKEWYGC